MLRRRILVEEVSHKIVVGIIGKGILAEALRKKLEEKDCRVLVGSSFSNLFTSCRYIFQIDQLAEIPRIHKYCQKYGMKHLIIATSLVVTNRKSFIFHFYKMAGEDKHSRLLFVGNVDGWDKGKLLETILWAMYNGKSQLIMDFTKEEFDPKKIITKNKAWGRRWHFWSKYIFLISIFLVPVFFVVINFLFLFIDLSSFGKMIANGKWEDGPGVLRSIQNDVYYNSLFLSIARGLLRPLGGSPGDWETVNKIAQKTVLVGEAGISARQIFTAEKKNLFNTSGRIDNESLNRLSVLLKDLDENLGDIVTELDSLKLSFFPKEVYIEKVRKAEDGIKTARVILPIYKKISDRDKPYTFLILFQNNMELRPTGGFIGSYGILNLKGGRLSSFNIHDVYEADGQLRAHVDPPQAIRQYLSQPNWFLRDSNFDPDFSLSAQQAMWFLEQETGIAADGVVGMNLNLLHDVLSAVGPIYISDYRDNITADNLFLKSTVYIQKDFFPGSSAKKDFLGSVARSLLFTFSDSDRVDFQKIGRVLSDSLDKKNLIFYFSDPTLQSMVEEKGWGGRMIDVSCAESNCYPDYLAISEANLGVNKANLYVKKDINIKKTISSDLSISSLVTIDYKNESPADVFPTGPYKNFLRIFVPKDAMVSSLSVGGVTVDNPVRKNYGDDKEEVDIYIEVTAGSTKRIIMDYVLVNNWLSSDKTYQFFYQKQPGDRDANLDIGFQFPASWKISARNFPQNAKEGKLLYFGDTSVDRVFIIDANSGINY